MAITAKAVWEGRTTGTATGGGAYDSGVAGVGVDYTQQDSPQLTVTDGSITTGTTALSSSTGGFTGEMIGNGVYISSDPTQRYIITAYTNTNTVTIDRNITTGGTGLTVNVGGAISDLATITFASVNGNLIYLKYHSTNVYEVSGGLTTRTEAVISTTFARAWTVKGYDQASERTVNGTASNRPTIRRTDTTVLQNQSHAQRWVDIIFDINDTAAGLFDAAAQSIMFFRCKFINGVNNQKITSSGTRLFWCEIGEGMIQGSDSFHCVALTNTDYYVFNTGNAINSIAIQTSGTRQGIAYRLYNFGYNVNCLAVGFSEGYRIDNNSACLAYGCIAVDCTYGFLAGATLASASTLIQCATYNCTNNVYLYLNTMGYKLDNNLIEGNYINLTENPFVDSASYNFNLNKTPAGGSLLRTMLDPDLFPGLCEYVDSHRDIGFLQHADVFEGRLGRLITRTRA